jgi:hypothetical protein
MDVSVGVVKVVVVYMGVIVASLVVWVAKLKVQIVFVGIGIMVL